MKERNRELIKKKKECASLCTNFFAGMLCSALTLGVLSFCVQGFNQHEQDEKLDELWADMNGDARVEELLGDMQAGVEAGQMPISEYLEEHDNLKDTKDFSDERYFIENYGTEVENAKLAEIEDEYDLVLTASAGLLLGAAVSATMGTIGSAVSSGLKDYYKNEECRLENEEGFDK